MIKLNVNFGFYSACAIRLIERGKKKEKRKKRERRKKGTTFSLYGQVDILEIYSSWSGILRNKSE